MTHLSQLTPMRLRPISLVAASLAAVSLALLVGGCNDPFLDAEIEELGGEQPGFEPGPRHRAGQPCLRCHGVYRGQGPLMSVAGTVFLEPQPGIPLQLVEGITVRLQDSEGNVANVVTNACGNFFVTPVDYNPAFPVRTELWGLSGAGEPMLLRPMASRIGRDGSCGSCHVDPSSPYTPGVVFVPLALMPPNARIALPGECPEPRFAVLP